MAVKNALGVVVRIGAGGFSLRSPAGAVDLRPLDRSQLSATASLLSDALGLKDRSPHRDGSSRRSRRHTNRS